MPAKPTAYTPAVASINPKSCHGGHWSLGVSLVNVIIHHERLSHHTCGVAVYYSLSTRTLHLPTYMSPYSPLLSYIADDLLQLDPLGAPLVVGISSIASVNSSAPLYYVRDLPS
jgi:hypothetical protein